ncbi:MAG: T9SS type A sorting domain-containing protein [Bacteroidota bacterium]|nr:T9SS type A sorting domain-containing protein [Bacteroidota bacterium]MDP3145992.1 T9SS type A sorting domain-containing protein [Bacteroidota bacterium]
MKLKKLTLLSLLIFLFFYAKSQSVLWGTTSGNNLNTGIFNYGTIFSVPTGSSNITSYELKGNPIGPSSGFIKASNQKLYAYSSINLKDEIFEYNVGSNTPTVLYTFINSLNGKKPLGRLLEASNGKLYGTCSVGGANNFGALFQFDVSNGIYTKLIDFTSATGTKPNGDLIEASNGKLYGTCYFGGANGVGTLFEYNIVTNSIIALINFSATLTGANPASGVIQASDGFIYGTTIAGGTNSQGKIFKYNLSSGTISVPHDCFTGGTIYSPCTKLIEKGGKLYGGALAVSNSSACVYSIKLTDSTIINYGVFNSRKPNYDYNISDINGNLCGVSYGGGTSNVGYIYKVDTVNNALVTVLNFSGFSTDAFSPIGSLLHYSNGIVYFIGNSCVGEFNSLTNVVTRKVVLNFAINGSTPSGPLTQATNGKFYGLTTFGGLNDKGVLYEFNPITFAYSKLVDFSSSSTFGGNPRGTLTLGPNGKLYGSCQNYGANSNGMFFEFDPFTNTVTKKFDYSISIGTQCADAIVHSSGFIYMLPRGGGPFNTGTALKYNVYNSTVTKIFDLNSTQDGGGIPLEATNGLLYAPSRYGMGGWGSMCVYGPTTNSLTNLLSFNSLPPNGVELSGRIVQALNGKIYGVTISSNGPGNGDIYEYDIPSNTRAFKYGVTNATGINFYGGLIKASNNKFYGLANTGGAFGCGTLIEYDNISNTVINKLDFNMANGFCPGSYLTEVTNQLPQPILFTSQQNSVCINALGAIYSFIPQSGVTYSWSYSGSGASFSNILGNSTSVTFTTGATNGSLIVTGINSIGSNTVATFPISLNPAFTMAITSATNTICNGNLINIGASGAASYTWNNNGSTSNLISVTPSVTTIYTVTGTNSIGCKSSVNQTINVLPLPVISVNINTTPCYGQTCTLTATGANTYTWNNGYIGAQNITTVTSGNFTVTGTNTTNGCLASKIYTTMVKAIPVYTLSISDTLVCDGQSVTMLATAASSVVFSWHTFMSSPVNSNSLIITPSVTITYTLNASAPNGCNLNVPITITVVYCTGEKSFAFQESEINIYPNPNYGDFYIETEQNQLEVCILNSLGQIIFTDKLIKGKNEINMINAMNGIYFVKVNGNLFSKVFKIIKY